MKSNKGKLTGIGSSIKNSFIRFQNSIVGRVLFSALLLSLVGYMLLNSISYYLQGELVRMNTEELSSDKSIQEIAYINEDGKVFLENGATIEKSSYSGYVTLLYGNKFWYSTNNSVLAVPMTLKQSITNATSYVLIESICYIVVMLLVGMLLKSTSFKNKTALIYVVACISIIVTAFDLATCFSISGLFSNVMNGLGYWIGYLISVIFISLKVIVFVKYLNNVASR